MRNCQIFTPDIIVDKMLDMLNCQAEELRTKTIFEPSFGDGAFLTKIVHRIVQYAQKENLSNSDIVKMLDNIYGVEIDSKLYHETIAKLNEFLTPIGVTYDWKNLIIGDSLTYEAPIQFDKCIANPPFIRIHSLSQTERDCIRKHYLFGTGNTDLYVIFFELCIKKMKTDGKMCFITPNSFLRNTSQSKFRDYLAQNNLVDTIVDYGNFQVFDNVLTYAAITLLDFDKKDTNTKCIRMKDFNHITSTSNINLQTFGKEPWVFLENLNNNTGRLLSELCSVQYGIATNADSVYLVSEENSADFEPELLRPVMKGSTLDNSKRIIFPYYWDEITCRYHVISENDMLCFYPKTYRYLLSNKEKLLQRDMEKGCLWYQYARSQGIQNSRCEKIVLKQILSPNVTSCSYQVCDEQYLVYSGIFIVPKSGIEISEILNILKTKEFYQYAFESGKDMSGGYKSINTKIIKNYQNKTVK